MNLRNLPLGESSFEKIINKNFIYVDKTDKIYNLITKGQYYFLSRPRRFGKSLLVSTLKNIFCGNKELFKNLWIYNSDWQWEKHPVITIDFNTIKLSTPPELEKGLISRLKDIAKENDIELKDADYKETFYKLILECYKKTDKYVVILIDEYDKPIIEHIGKGKERLKIAEENREILKSFFEILKGESVISKLRFVLLTGVSKFSRAGVFSALNNLSDLTMHSEYSDLLGITEEELKNYFDEYLELCSEKFRLKKEELIERIRNYYNGYRFSEEDITVYNPFSLLSFFNNKKFKNYWFETGTPTFLVNLIKERNYYIPEAENLEVTESIFSTYEIEDLNIEALLFQTGYLTIKDYDFEINTYLLSYPNKEVKYSFLENLFKSITKNKENKYIRLGKYLRKGDVNNFIEIAKAIFSGISYTIGGKINEATFHSLFYVMLNAGGMPADMEMITCEGRIDMVVELKDRVYIIEFKCNQSAEKAIAQIKEKKYYQPFIQSGKRIYLIGINFDTEKRNISDWKWERI